MDCRKIFGHCHLVPNFLRFQRCSKIQSDLSPLGYSVFQMVLETHNVSLFRKIFEVLETLIFCCKKIVRSIESSEDSAKESSIKG